MERSSPQLTNIFRFIWEELKEGAVDRRHPFHLCFLSTIGSGDVTVPESRILVLRDVDTENFSLRSNADLRSNKCLEIKRNPNTHLLFYNKEKKIQVRIAAESTVIGGQAITEEAWLESQDVSKRCYFSPFSPSTIIQEPFSNTMLDLKDENLGLNVFGLITSKAKEIDYLELNYEGHTRCHFVLFNGELQSSEWLAP